VPNENRNYLPIKHLYNTQNALFGTNRINSVHDTVHARLGLPSPIISAIASHWLSISASSQQGKRTSSLLAGAIFYAAHVGHNVAKRHEGDASPKVLNLTAFAFRIAPPYRFPFCAGLYAFFTYLPPTSAQPAAGFVSALSLPISVTVCVFTEHADFSERV
jgi:hypothetical protein